MKKIGKISKMGEKKNDLFGLKVLTMLIIVILTVSAMMLLFFKPVSEYSKYKDEFLEKSKGLQIGDVYSFSYHKDNPFEKEEVYYYRVIDKKLGYVQYVDTLTLDTMSMEIEYFMSYFKKVNTKK